MDSHSFDRWTVALSQRPSRRAAARLLVGGLLGGLLARGGGPVRAQTCIALGGACSGIDLPCCGNDPATFGYNNVICCSTDLTGGSACTDIAGTFLCPAPAAVPPTGCPEGMTQLWRRLHKPLD